MGAGRTEPLLPRPRSTFARTRHAGNLAQLLNWLSRSYDRERVDRRDTQSESNDRAHHVGARRIRTCRGQGILHSGSGRKNMFLPVVHIDHRLFTTSFSMQAPEGPTLTSRCVILHGRFPDEPTGIVPAKPREFSERFGLPAWG